MTNPLLLPGFGAELPLFAPDDIGRYVSERGDAGIETTAKLIEEWLDDISRSKGTESALEASFVQRILVDALGYTPYPAAGATFAHKPNSSLSHLSGTPDGVMARQILAATDFAVACEFKSRGTDFEKPQLRDNNETPIEQGFRYGRQLLGCRWVLVTDMVRLRLYSVDSPNAYHPFDLRECRIQSGTPTRALREFRHLLHYDALVHIDSGSKESAVMSLYVAAAERKRALKRGFFDFFEQAQRKLVGAIGDACATAGVTTSSDILSATQRLMDRLLFVAYCQDHPSHLIPQDTLKRVVLNARMAPGPRKGKVYAALKDFFKEVDSGSPEPMSKLAVAAYNGELFKYHPIIDEIEISDDLHDEELRVQEEPGRWRSIQGVWGFWGYDFWRELDEHVLGAIFQESLNTLRPTLGGVASVAPTAVLGQRALGVFYTDEILARFTVESVLADTLDAMRTGALAVPTKGLSEAESNAKIASLLEEQIERLLSLRIIDPACGSGAFIVSAFRIVLATWHRLQEQLNLLRALKHSTPDLFTHAASATQAQLLRNTLFGADLLPQAVEIAKLSLWLRSAHKGEKVASLDKNLVACNSLDLATLLKRVDASPGSFDLVVGNPPWGGEHEPGEYEKAVSALGLTPGAVYDTWELFLFLGLRLLKDGGRLAFVLPYTIFRDDKDQTRKYLLESTSIERIYHLGADWFTSDVRMDSIVLQIRKTRPVSTQTFIGTHLSGDRRKAALNGRVLLSQVEATEGQIVEQDSALGHKRYRIYVSCGPDEKRILGSIESHQMATPPFVVEGQHRGEELSKAGTLWKCQSMGCSKHYTPPDVRRSRTYKKCPFCAAKATAKTATVVNAIFDIGISTRPTRWAPLVENFDDVIQRFKPPVARKGLRLGLSGFPYKDSALFKAPKILVREAGIGITAALDYSDARCVRSLYALRMSPALARRGYEIEFVYAALMSRAMLWYVFLTTNQDDAASAFANLRIEDVMALPFPNVDFTDMKQKTIHAQIVADAKLLMGGAKPNGAEDMRIEQNLWTLMGITADDGVLISQRLARAPRTGPVAQFFA